MSWRDSAFPVLGADVKELCGQASQHRSQPKTSLHEEPPAPQFLGICFFCEKKNGIDKQRKSDDKNLLNLIVLIRRHWIHHVLRQGKKKLIQSKATLSMKISTLTPQKSVSTKKTWVFFCRSDQKVGLAFLRFKR